jgi:hypothetical protein
MYLRGRFRLDMEAVAPDLLAARQGLSAHDFSCLTAKFVFDTLDVFSGQDRLFK